MSTTESAAVFVTEDNKDLITANWASSIWWNDHQQVSLSAAVNDFNYDYPVSYDATACEDNSGPFYSVPALNASENPWPMSGHTVANEAEPYVTATPMSSTVDSYKYPTTHSAADYAMLECYSSVADPSQALQWTSVPYTDSTSGVSAYELCSSAPMPSVFMDYCNSLQMIQYDAAFNGFALSTNQFQSDADHIRQQPFVDKTASTRVSL